MNTMLNHFKAKYKLSVFLTLLAQLQKQQQLTTNNM